MTRTYDGATPDGNGTTGRSWGSSIHNAGVAGVQVGWALAHAIASVASGASQTTLSSRSSSPMIGGRSVASAAVAHQALVCGVRRARRNSTTADRTRGARR